MRARDNYRAIGRFVALDTRQPNGPIAELVRIGKVVEGDV